MFLRVSNMFVNLLACIHRLAKKTHHNKSLNGIILDFQSTKLCEGYVILGLEITKIHFVNG